VPKPAIDPVATHLLTLCRENGWTVRRYEGGWKIVSGKAWVYFRLDYSKPPVRLVLAGKVWRKDRATRTVFFPARQGLQPPDIPMRYAYHWDKILGELEDRFQYIQEALGG